MLNTPDIICMQLSKLAGSAVPEIIDNMKRGNREQEMADFNLFVIHEP